MNILFRRILHISISESIFLLFGLILLGSCSRRFVRLRENERARIGVAIPTEEEKPVAVLADSSFCSEEPITYTTLDGKTLHFVPASYDEQIQESVMNVQIEQVTISVRNLRNVAERNGKVNLEFSVTIPPVILNDKWRVELEPMLCTTMDTTHLQKLIFTGDRFRRFQRQEFARYQRYLDKIVDSTDYFQYFGDIAGFEEYLLKAAEQREQLLANKHLLDSFSSNDKNKSYSNLYYDTHSYRHAMRRLMRLDARAERRRRHTIARIPKSVDSGALVAYLLPEYRPVTVSDYERELRREFSDSSRIQRRHIRKRNVEANIRVLSSLDTVALMREYYNLRKVERNEKKIRNKHEVFQRIVHFPEIQDARIDTVVHADQSITYHYSEQITANEYTDRIRLFLRGTVTEIGGRSIRLPESDTLTYTVASMISFVDSSPRYLRQIIRRDAEVNARFFFVFPQGKFRLQEELADNYEQLKRIEELTQRLMTDPVYRIDSITLTATSSPEGAWRVNERLARKRSLELKQVLERKFRKLKDSLEISGVYVLDAGGRIQRVESESEIPDIPNLLRATWRAEDWSRLRRLIAMDTLLSNQENILALIDSEKDPDRCERLIRKRFPASYSYMYSKFYPQLRAVDFRFSLHRRGMKQDTVWTTVLDSTYMEGVRFLQRRHYDEALERLRPYDDYNTALAYMSVGLDRAAFRILKREAERQSGKAYIHYVLSVVAARLNDQEPTLRSLMRAVELEPRLRFRANLDPELSSIVRRYNLFEK